jgi:hypothetical protein
MSDRIKELVERQTQAEKSDRDRLSQIIAQREYAKENFYPVWQQLRERIESDVDSYNNERRSKHLELIGESCGACKVRRLLPPVASVYLRPDKPTIYYGRESGRSIQTVTPSEGTLTVAAREDQIFFRDEISGREMFTINEVSEFLLGPVWDPKI